MAKKEIAFMANRQKEKGTRFEHQIVATAEAAGLKAYRVPLSAAGSIKNDVHVKQGRTLWEIEAKKRADGFKFLYDNIQGADILVVGADRKPALAVIDLRDLFDIMAGKHD